MKTRRRFAAALVGVACWTLVIKFLLPVGAALRDHLPLATYVMWDFWWVAHLVLARALLKPDARTWWFAVLVSWVEIAIIGTKFTVFLQDPHWTFWKTNWFVNKCVVLTLFMTLAWYLHRVPAGRKLRAVRVRA